MSIQQNFPAISPSLNLNFARSKTLDPRITFSRTSTATRVNEQGLVEVVSADIPRFDHEYDASTGVIKSLGLLVEESSSNLITYSEDFTQSIWDAPVTGRSRATRVTSTGIDDPSGGTTAATYKNGGTAADELIWRAEGGTANVPYTMSVWIRRRTGTGQIDFVVGDNIAVEVTNQVTTEWKRISVTATPTQTTIRAYIQILGINDEIDIWGYQLEQKAFPTSYIPTSGGTATRNPDNVSMTGDNFSDWYNQEQGSFLWIGNVYSREISPVQPFRVNQGANLRGLGIQFDTRSANNSTSFVSRTQTSNIPGKVAPSGIIPSDNKIKIAGGYIESVGLSTIRAAFNGLPEDSYTGSSQTDITYDTMYEIEIMGNRGISGTNNQFTGVCEQLVYYPRILTDAQLQNLTK